MLAHDVIMRVAMKLRLDCYHRENGQYCLLNGSQHVLSEQSLGGYENTYGVTISFVSTEATVDPQDRRWHVVEVLAAVVLEGFEKNMMATRATRLSGVYTFLARSGTYQEGGLAYE